MSQELRNARDALESMGEVPAELKRIADTLAQVKALSLAAGVYNPFTDEHLDVLIRLANNCRITAAETQGLHKYLAEQQKNRLKLAGVDLR